MGTTAQKMKRGDYVGFGVLVYLACLCVGILFWLAFFIPEERRLGDYWTIVGGTAGAFIALLILFASMFSSWKDKTEIKTELAEIKCILRSIDARLNRDPPSSEPSCESGKP